MLVQYMQERGMQVRGMQVRDSRLVKRARAAGAGRALSVLALGLLATCRQLVGIKERQVFDAEASGTVVLACGLPNRGSLCAACMSQSCCAEAEECVADSPCLLSERCVQNCATGDSACRLGCSGQWDPVSLAQGRLLDCREASCADACGPWDCLGNASWQIPEPMPDSITISATTVCGECSPSEGPAPNPGVHVRVCSMADPACEAELTSGDSDADGRVSLTLSPAGNPLSVFLQFEKRGWVDDLLLLNTPPLSYDFDVGAVGMDELDNVYQIAADLDTTYDPALAVVKLRVNDCNLQPNSGVELTWEDAVGASIDASFDRSGWDAVAVNLPVPATRTTRVVARRTEPDLMMSSAAELEPLVASANLVVRAGAITLAPFVTPTPRAAGGAAR
jgi:hypothetical protein